MAAAVMMAAPGLRGWGDVQLPAAVTACGEEWSLMDEGLGELVSMRGGAAGVDAVLSMLFAM